MHNVILIDNETGYIVKGLNIAAATAAQAETQAVGEGYLVNEGKTRLDAPEPGADNVWLVRVTE